MTRLLQEEVFVNLTKVRTRNSDSSYDDTIDKFDLKIHMGLILRVET